jgi:hypothetical protein
MLAVMVEAIEYARAGGPLTGLDGVAPAALATVADEPIDICFPVHRRRSRIEPVPNGLSKSLSSPRDIWSMMGRLRNDLAMEDHGTQTRK